MIEDRYQRQGTMHDLHKGRSSLTDRLEMTIPARTGAQSMSQQTTPPENSTRYAGLEATCASHLEASVPEGHPRAARQARIPTFSLGLQPKTGQKRHLDDYDEEAKAGEPLHKRPRAKASRQEDRGDTVHERMSGTRGTEDDAAKHARAKQSPREARWVSPYISVEDRYRHQGRGDLGMDAVKSSHDGTDEAKQRWKNPDVESSGIAPLNMATRSSGILQNSNSSRPIFGSLQKKVRFEDDISDKVLEKQTCFSNRVKETPKTQLAGFGPHILNAIQRETLDQPADADVIMVDV